MKLFSLGERFQFSYDSRCFTELAPVLGRETETNGEQSFLQVTLEQLGKIFNLNGLLRALIFPTDT